MIAILLGTSILLTACAGKETQQPAPAATEAPAQTSEITTEETETEES